MSIWLPSLLLVLAFAAADLPKLPLVPAPERNSTGKFSSGESISVLPLLFADRDTQSGNPQQPAASKNSTLTEPSKLPLSGYVSGDSPGGRTPNPAGNG